MYNFYGTFTTRNYWRVKIKVKFCCHENTLWVRKQWEKVFVKWRQLRYNSVSLCTLCAPSWTCFAVVRYCRMCWNTLNWKNSNRAVAILRQSKFNSSPPPPPPPYSPNKRHNVSQISTDQTLHRSKSSL